MAVPFSGSDADVSTRVADVKARISGRDVTGTVHAQINSVITTALGAQLPRSDDYDRDSFAMPCIPPSASTTGAWNDTFRLRLQSSSSAVGHGIRFHEIHVHESLQRVNI